jgi:hypothetical protein
MAGRFIAVVAVTLVAGCVPSGGAGAAREAGPGGGSIVALEGAWSREGGLDEILGFPRNEGPQVLEFTADERARVRWKEEQRNEVHVELRRLGHRFVATAQVRPDEGAAHEWIITHRDGDTYGCVVVPNLGLLAHRLGLVPGAARDRDLLFVEWGTPEGERRLVSAYRRARQGPTTRPAEPPPAG